jgi:hypothetical protein
VVPVLGLAQRAIVVVLPTPSGVGQLGAESAISLSGRDALGGLAVVGRLPGSRVPPLYLGR